MGQSGGKWQKYIFHTLPTFVFVHGEEMFLYLSYFWALIAGLSSVFCELSGREGLHEFDLRLGD